MSAGNTQKGTRLRAPFSVYTDAKGTSVEIVNSAGVIQGTLPDAPTGNVVVATAKTLTVTDADALLVGGKIVPQTFFVSLGQGSWPAPKALPVACKVVSVKERHTTAESTAATLTGMLKKVPSGTAASAGTDCLAAGVNLKGTANTNASPSLHATAANYTLAAGDALAIVASTTITELAGAEFTVELQRV